MKRITNKRLSKPLTYDTVNVFDIVPELLPQVIRYIPFVKKIVTTKVKKEWSREKNLFNWLLVSKTWFSVVYTVIRKQLYYSTAPLYEYTYEENSIAFDEAFESMKNHDWCITNLCQFLKPRVLQPYRAKHRRNRTIHIHITGAPYLEETISNTVGLLKKYLDVNKGGRYENQFIDINRTYSSKSSDNAYIMFVSSLQQALTQVDRGLDNPFILIKYDLNIPMHSYMRKHIYSILKGEVINTIMSTQYRFCLPKGTVLIIVSTSFYAGYLEKPEENASITEHVIFNRMILDQYEPEAITNLNKNIIVFT